MVQEITGTGLNQRKFQLEMWNIFVIFLTMNIVKCQKKVSSEAVGDCPSSSLEMLLR